MPNKLRPNQILNVGDSIISDNKRFCLVLQRDGNLVIYKLPSNTALWSTGTVGETVMNAVMQADGNFVLYKSDGATPLFHTNTFGHPNAEIVMQDDGNLVIYDGATAIWHGPGVYQPPALLLRTITVEAISHLRVTAGWDNRRLIPTPETKNQTSIYNPPPGFAVLSTRTIVHQSNNGSRSVSVMAEGLNLVTEENLTEVYDAAIGFALRLGKLDLKGNLEDKKNNNLSALRHFQTNRNTIHATVTAAGHGIPGHDQKRGWDEISVMADLLYIGSPNKSDIAAAIEEEFGIDIPNI